MGHSTNEDHKNISLDTCYKCSGDWRWGGGVTVVICMVNTWPALLGQFFFFLAKTDLFSSVDIVSKPCQSLTYKTIHCKILQFKAQCKTLPFKTQCKTLQFKTVISTRTSSCTADGFISQHTHMYTHTHTHTHACTHSHTYAQPALKQNYHGCINTSCLKQEAVFLFYIHKCCLKQANCFWIYLYM